MQNIEPEIYKFTDGPNNKELPVLIYRGVLADEEDKTTAFKRRYNANSWRGAWVDTVYTYQHFHTNAHEALGIAEGNMRVELGGDNGRVFDLITGDLIILPAGTIHRRLSKGKVVVVGAYPTGQENYTINQDVESHSHDEDIQNVPCPATDPLFGASGPLVKLWAC